MSSSDPGGLHQQILETAKKLFIRYGYHGLSMRQIAEAVGVSKAALYYHFQDKEQLFLAILDDNLREIESLIRQVERDSDDSRARIRALVRGILLLPAEKRAVIRLASQEMAQLNAPARAMFDQSYHEKFINRVRSILKAGIARGELKPVEPELATWALLGMMYPYFYPVHAADVPPPEKVIDGMLEIYMEGIAFPS